MQNNLKQQRVDPLAVSHVLDPSGNPLGSSQGPPANPANYLSEDLAECAVQSPDSQAIAKSSRAKVRSLNNYFVCGHVTAATTLALSKMLGC